MPNAGQILTCRVEVENRPPKFDSHTLKLELIFFFKSGGLKKKRSQFDWLLLQLAYIEGQKKEYA